MKSNLIMDQEERSINTARNSITDCIKSLSNFVERQGDKPEVVKDFLSRGTVEEMRRGLQILLALEGHIFTSSGTDLPDSTYHADRDDGTPRARCYEISVPRADFLSTNFRLYPELFGDFSVKDHSFIREMPNHIAKRWITKGQWDYLNILVNKVETILRKR